MSNIRIDIASEFKDKGFKNASKSATALERQFKNLAKTFLAVFSTRQVIAFGKAAVNAFAQDEVAARRLTQTLTSMNLGFEDPRITAYISELERQSGILDDQLRPAMESFLRTTGSVTTSQNLLATAIDVAAGSGIALETVASDLSRAYVGNNRGLLKYNLGLTKTELAGKSFLEIQERLTKQYSGQNAAFLNTYAGRVNVLRVAYANMEETIGKGLVDAFTELSGDRGIGGASQAIEDFGNNVAFAIGGAVSYVDMLNRSISGIGLNPLIKSFITSQGPVQLLQTLIEAGKRAQAINAPRAIIPMGGVSRGEYPGMSREERLRAQAEKDAAKRAKELAALQKKAEQEKKKREALEKSRKRAQTIFDMENIQIVAALQGQVDGEQRTRLVTLLALNTENYKAAEKLADIVIRINEPALRNLGVMIEAGDSVDDLVKKLITSQARLAALQLTAEDFPELDNPFDEWEDSLEKILEMLMKILAMASGKPTSIARPIQPTTGAGSGASANEWMRMMDQLAKVGQLPETSPTMDLGMDLSGLFRNASTTSQSNVNVYVQGNVTTERDLVQSLTNALYQTQKTGQSIIVSSTAI